MKTYYESYYKWCEKFNLDPGIKKGNYLGIGKIENFQNFQKIYNPPKISDNWIYANYDQLKGWSLNEPKDAKLILKIVND